MVPLLARNKEFRAIYDYYVTRAKNPLKRRQANGGKEVLDDTKQSAQDIVSDITSFGSKKIEELTSKAEKTLNNFIEATAVMVITSCIFPLLVVLFFFWLMKVFLGINIDVSKFTKPGKKGTKMAVVEEK